MDWSYFGVVLQFEHFCDCIHWLGQIMSKGGLSGSNGLNKERILLVKGEKIRGLKRRYKCWRGLEVG